MLIIKPNISIMRFGSSCISVNCALGRSSTRCVKISDSLTQVKVVTAQLTARSKGNVIQAGCSRLQ